MSDAPNAPPPLPPGEADAPPDPSGTDRRLAMLGAGLLLVAFVSLGSLTQVLNVAYGIWFTEIFLFLGLTAVLLRWSGRDPITFPELDRGRLALFLFGFAVGAVNLFALGIPLQFLAQQLAPDDLRKIYDAANLFKNQTPLELAIIAGGVALAAPFCEEYFFRGVFLKGLLTRHAEAKAVVISAVVFSAFHLDPVGLVPRTELGIVFGYLYLRTRSLWPCIAAHAANNSVSMAAYFVAKDQAGEGDEVTAEVWTSIGMLVLLGVPALYAIFRLGLRQGLLQPRESAPRPLLPPKAFGRLAWPWALGAAAATALLFAVDRRGVQLNWIDARFALSKGATEEDKTRLRALRVKARRGELPVADYETARRALRAP